MQEKNITFSSFDILDKTLSCTWNKHSGGLLQGPKLCDVLCLQLHHHKRGQETLLHQQFTVLIDPQTFAQKMS